MDPMTMMALAQGVISLFSSGGGQSAAPGFDPTDQMTRQGLVLSGASPEEELLARLQQALAQNAYGAAGGPLPGSLDLGGLAAGVLPAASAQRIDTLAYGGLDESLRRAARINEERSLSSGNFGSSMAGTALAEMQTPLLLQANQMRASLHQEELGRLEGLRERSLANMLALQESPALERLLRLRLATGEQRGLQMGRNPGGLPGYAYSEDFFSSGGLGGKGSMVRNTPQKITLATPEGRGVGRQTEMKFVEGGTPRNDQGQPEYYVGADGRRHRR